MRRIVTGLAVVAGLLVLGGPAALADPITTEVLLPPTGAPGDSFTVSTSGFDCDQVQATWDGDAFGDPAMPPDLGETVPATASAGEHSVGVRGIGCASDSPETSQVFVVVLGSTPGTPTPTPTQQPRSTHTAAGKSTARTAPTASRQHRVAGRRSAGQGSAARGVAGQVGNAGNPGVGQTAPPSEQPAAGAGGVLSLAPSSSSAGTINATPHDSTTSAAAGPLISSPSAGVDAEGPARRADVASAVPVSGAFGGGLAALGGTVGALALLVVGCLFGIRRIDPRPSGEGGVMPFADLRRRMLGGRGGARLSVPAPDQSSDAASNRDSGGPSSGPPSPADR